MDFPHTKKIHRIVNPLPRALSPIAQPSSPKQPISYGGDYKIEYEDSGFLFILLTELLLLGRQGKIQLKNVENMSS